VKGTEDLAKRLVPRDPPEFCGHAARNALTGHDVDSADAGEKLQHAPNRLVLEFQIDPNGGSIFRVDRPGEGGAQGRRERQDEASTPHHPITVASAPPLVAVAGRA
jgi:hypothetical protein